MECRENQWACEGQEKEKGAFKTSMPEKCILMSFPPSKQSTEEAQLQLSKTVIALTSAESLLELPS
jgi:hypothetical protein